MPRGNETILVVDDDEYILDIAQSALMQYGYTVLTAPDGLRALHMLQCTPDLKIDVAVLDIVMPLMDGFELADKLLKIRPDLPILYMSAFSQNTEMRSSRMRNITFIPKPFTPLALAQKVRGVLEVLEAK